MDLKSVYEEYFPKIYNFFFYRVMHKEVAEDLTSIVFLKVAEKFHTYNAEKGSVSTWLYTIAQNALNDYFRTRHIPVSLDDISGSLVLSVDFEEQSTLIKDEARRALYDALSELDDRTRDIMSQKYFMGRQIREIAADKGMNESTVSTIHNRGLKKLRKSMSAFEL